MLHSTIDLAAQRLRGRAARPRILAATSGSAASAAVSANERDAELIIVHACPPTVLRVGRLAPTIVHTLRLDAPHASPVLSTARQVAWANGAFARVILISGDPAPAVLSIALEMAVDLIVIGARPSRRPAALAGPARYRIRRDARCPVRVIALTRRCAGHAVAANRARDVTVRGLIRSRRC